MTRRMRRPSPALIVASLALVVALGGTSYAAIKLPKNSVGSKQIKKNAVTSAKVKNHSLTSGDFKAGQLPAGPAGPPGVAFGVLSYRASAPVDNPIGSQDSAEAVCSPGTFAVGGGGLLSGDVGQEINSSFPSSGAGDGNAGVRGWSVFADNTTADAQTVVAFVICAPAGALNKAGQKAVNKAGQKAGKQ